MEFLSRQAIDSRGEILLQKDVAKPVFLPM